MPKPTAKCLKRVMKEFKTFETNPDPFFEASYDIAKNDILTWYYVIKGAAGSPYEGGEYLGTLKLQHDYPFKPPSIIMHTPNGRFHLDKRICLSISDYHPESWNPGLNLRSVILGIQSFMSDEGDPSTLGSLRESNARRKQLAKQSHAWNKKNVIFKKYFGEKKKKKKQEQKSSSSSSSSSSLLSNNKNNNNEFDLTGDIKVATPVIESALSATSSSRVPGKKKQRARTVSCESSDDEPEPIAAPKKQNKRKADALLDLTDAPAKTKKKKANDDVICLF